MRTAIKNLPIGPLGPERNVVLFKGSSHWIFSARPVGENIWFGIATISYLSEVDYVKEYSEPISMRRAKSIIEGKRVTVSKTFGYRSEPVGIGNVKIGCTTFRKSTLRSVLKKVKKLAEKGKQ